MQKAYGTAAVGALLTWIKQARTRAAEAAQCGGRGRCLTTTIAQLHPSADPAIRIPCNLIRQWLIFWEHNHRTRPKIGKVWAKIATAMMARSPTTRWRYVRGHLSVVIVTLLQHNWIPTRHASWQDPEGIRWSLKAGGVGLMIGDSGKPSELRSRSNCGRRLQGTSWEQVWMAEQTSPRCSNMTSSWREGPACSPKHAVGSGYSVELDAGATISSRAGGVAALPEMRRGERGHVSPSLAMPS